MALTLKEHGALARRYYLLTAAAAILNVVALGVAAEARFFDLNHMEELVGPIPDEYNDYAVLGGLLTSILAVNVAGISYARGNKSYGIWKRRGVPKRIKLAPIPPTTRP